MVRGNDLFDWEAVGAMLAQLDDQAQAKFFHGFCKEAKTWGTHLMIERQLAFVNRNLSAEEKEILGMLGYNE